MPSRRPGWIWLILGGVAVAVLIGFLAWRFPDALAARDGRIQLTHSLLILALVGSSFLLHRRGRPGSMLRSAAIWAGIAAVVFAGYSFRDEFAVLGDRMMGELLPHRAGVQGDAVVFRKAEGGHFVAEALVDGVPIRFLVDTGATDVVLSPADARRLGFDTDMLRYSKTYRTANGTVSGAPVTLGTVAIGPVAVAGVRASVNRADMGRSLLGMSFLSRLAGYEVRGNSLTLHP